MGSCLWPKLKRGTKIITGLKRIKIRIRVTRPIRGMGRSL
jgi:hypothetical protein